MYEENAIPDKPDIKSKERNSNLELYRIIVMLLIVAHHYVVNSGPQDIKFYNKLIYYILWRV